MSRIALLTLKGRNEEKVSFSADHLRKDIEKLVGGWKDLILAGPAPAPLARAETFYRYQLMIRCRQMTALSQRLAIYLAGQQWPDDITVTVDIDPVNLS